MLRQGDSSGGRDERDLGNGGRHRYLEGVVPIDQTFNASNIGKK